MKRKTIIFSAVVLFMFIIVFIGIHIFNSRIVSIITLDINPSIQINLMRSEKVKSVIALNEEAKEVISKDWKNKDLENVLKSITDNLINKEYAYEDELLEVILYSKGNLSRTELEEKVTRIFREKQVDSHIIMIDKITKEDEKLAKKYHISPAKISYIKSITKENEKIHLEDLVDKSVEELKETHATGRYCDLGYILQGDWCLKEKERVSATDGEICPRGYYEYEGKCYGETPIEHTDELYCRDDFILKDQKCFRTIFMGAEPVQYTCPAGTELIRDNADDVNSTRCIDASNAKHPVSPCETHDGTEYTVSGGKCYWHRAPVIAAGCPGKILIGGMCWDDASNILICEGYRDGKRYTSRNEYCEHSIRYVDPIVSEYQCPSDYILEGTKCLKDEIEPAFYKQVCPSGYKLVNHDRCIDTNEIKEKENGLVCNMENSRLKGNTCIIYEMIEAKSK